MNRYLVLALRNPDFDPAVVEPHQAFLGELRAAGKLELAGPFADKSGGAYLLRADSPEEAAAIAQRDPLHTSGSSRVTVYEWNAA